MFYRRFLGRLFWLKSRMISVGQLQKTISKVKPILNKSINILLPLVALFYIGQKIWSVKADLFASMTARDVIWLVGLGSIMYAFNNIFLVIGWRQLINGFGETDINMQETVKIYGRSQILKYVPGNFFHLPSRHIMGRQAGLEHGPLLAGAGFEVVGLILTSSIISLLGVFFGNKQVLQPYWLILLFFFVVSFPFFLSIVFPRIPKLREIGLHHKKINEIYGILFSNWAAYLCFFLFTAIILWCIIFGVMKSWFVVPVGIVFLVYATSWLGGTITPGAPAGAGVRETIIVLMLAGFVGETNSVLIALILRTVTVLGDVYFYAVVQVLR